MAVTVSSKIVITASSPKKARAEIEKGMRFLAKHDAALKKIIKQVGPCQLKPRKEYFFILCDSIISQQLSVKVSNVLLERFRLLCAKSGNHPTPEEVLAADGEALRKCGLSYQKIAYLKDLAKHFAEKKIVPQTFHKLSDEEIIAELVAVKGIGRWTAEMFLIFSLCRLDIWPVDDLGIKKAVQKNYKLKAMPTAKDLLKFDAKKSWRPYRSIVAWYLWRTL
jgi:DNA-3-methyladenine glycosylase II